MSERVSIGVDFGTTNTVIAVARPGQPVEAIEFSSGNTVSDIYRSVLCFEKVTDGRSLKVLAHGGMNAIQTYLQAAFEMRLIQSFKSHVASRIFKETRIFQYKYRFEDLLGAFFSEAIKDSRWTLEDEPSQMIAGRPVSFVGTSPDEALAIRRYDAGYAKAGLPKPLYVYEPVGAAFFFAQRLKTDATVLVGDFGGGTSDFSLIRFERAGGVVKAKPLGYAGLGLAGDTFDFRIINAVISPRLGLGSKFRSMDKILDMPVYFYQNFAKWHQLALLKSRETMNELDSLRRASLEPEKLETFMEIIQNDRGFDLYRAVSSAKAELSSAHSVRLEVRLGSLDFDCDITRDDFEGWIAADLEKIARTVDDLLADSKVAPDEIDHVFLTGGSSFVPAVKRIFENRFGAERLGDGDNFQSVAYGLALVGLEENIEPWLARRPSSDPDRRSRSS